MPINPPSSPLAFAPRLEFTIAHSERAERFVLAAATLASWPGIEAETERWLSPREAERIARAVPKRRREFLLGRYAAKTALATWNREPSLAAYTITPGAFDQPIVNGPGGAEVTLAHTGDAAVAVAHDRGHPIGVDLESVDPERIDVVRSQVAATELPAAGSFLAPANRGEASPTPDLGTEAAQFFLLWSAKEALSKALRCGLTCPFALLAVADARLDEAGVCSGTFVNFGQYRFVAWLAGSKTFALVCSRNAQIETAVPAMQRFTREILEART